MARRGFTLVELLVVIIIMFILIGALVVIFGLIFRSQGVRAGALAFQTALAEARSNATKTRRYHFIKLFNRPSDGQGAMQIYIDSDQDKNLLSPPDAKIGEERELPSGIQFGLTDGVAPGTVGRYPDWIMIAPTGYIAYKLPYTSYAAGFFENQISLGTPVGDVVIKQLNKKMFMYLDIDEIAGKVRKAHFWGPP